MSTARKRAILIFAAFALVAAGADKPGAEPREDAMPSHEVQQVKIQQMQSALENRDTESSRRLLKEAYDLWRSVSGRDERQARSPYLEEMITECFSFGVDAAEARKYATAALAQPDDITAEVELSLVERATRAVQGRHVARHAQSFAGDEAARAEAARFYCHALARFEAEVDPTWTAAELNSLHEREKRIRFQIGIDAATAQREAAQLKKDLPAIVGRNIRQGKLLAASRALVPALERRVVKFYSQPPAAKEELGGYMKQYGVKPETADRVLRQVPDPPAPAAAKRK